MVFFLFFLKQNKKSVYETFGKWAEVRVCVGWAGDGCRWVVEGGCGWTVVVSDGGRGSVG